MRFSSRIPADLAPNRLSEALAGLRTTGGRILDLTAANPTHAGFAYPDDLLRQLGDAGGLAYRPQPLGAPATRRAVAADFERRGFSVDPERLSLTSSTSEAYSLIFKILCDPGDEVLVPRPSYPLFEHLTRLDAVTAVPYDLEYHGRWSIDFSTIEDAVSARTRAVLIVNPNNPTGNFIGSSEVDRLSAFCAGREIALISDEVFADYGFDADLVGTAGGALLGREDVLGFTLGGLSKSVGLPQVKLGWILVTGDSPARERALARLEVASDTYLSVSTPVQHAAADLLQRGCSIRDQIRERTAGNYRWLTARVARTPACRVLHSDGGWNAVIQVPTLAPEEELVLRLLVNDGVLVHPGYFFDFRTESYLVVSLLPPPSTFVEGIACILRHFDCSSGSP